MLVTLTLTFRVSVVNIAFYDFCGFRFVAVNSVYKLQFLHLFSFISVTLLNGRWGKSGTKSQFPFMCREVPWEQPSVSLCELEACAGWRHCRLCGIALELPAYNSYLYYKSYPLVSLLSPACHHGLLPGPFLLSYSVFVLSFPYFSLLCGALV